MEPPGYAGAGASARFTPLPFAHNGRVALALLPSAALAASAAGPAGVGAALAGAMLAYLLDLLRWGVAALGCCWVTLTAVYLSLVFGAGLHAERRPPLLEVAMLLALGQTLFLVGVWATLQARAGVGPGRAHQRARLAAFRGRARVLSALGARLRLA